MGSSSARSSALWLPGERPFGGEQYAEVDDVGALMVRYVRIFKILPTFISRRLARKVLPTAPECEITPWLAAKKRTKRDLLQVMRTLIVNQASAWSALTQITVPILMFTGDRDKGSIVSEAAAAKIRQVQPSVQFVHLEGASHDSRRWRFEGYINALRTFFAGLVLTDRTGSPAIDDWAPSQTSHEDCRSYRFAH